MRTLTGSTAFLVTSVSLCGLVLAEEAKHVEVAGAQFPYVEAGAGEPVLFVHAAWSDHRAWDGIQDEVAEEYRFASYIQRHYGAGDWPDDKPLADDVLGQDLVALLRHWDEPMHLVGYSSSGPTIFRAAIGTPQLVRSIVIFEPTMPEILEGSPEGEAAVADWGAGFAKMGEALEAGDNEAAVRHAIEYVFGLHEIGFDSLPEHNRMVLMDNAYTAPMRVATPPLTCEDLIPPPGNRLAPGRIP